MCDVNSRPPSEYPKQKFVLEKRGQIKISEGFQDAVLKLD